MVDQSIDGSSNILAHFGVKGMKWGVRKSDRSTSQSSDSKRASALKGKSRDSLSNSELKELTTRLQLEQQYDQLTSKPSAFKRGQQFVNNGLWLLNTINTVSNFAKGPIASSVKNNIFKD